MTGEGNGNRVPFILAWRIPWTEEPGGLLSIGSYRVGHDWSDLAAVIWLSLKEFRETLFLPLTILLGLKSLKSTDSEFIFVFLGSGQCLDHVILFLKVL